METDLLARVRWSGWCVTPYPGMKITLPPAAFLRNQIPPRYYSITGIVCLIP